MARRRRTRQQSKSKRPTGGRYTPPKEPGPLVVLLDEYGEPVGFGFLCEDPTCPEHHR